MDVPCLIWQFFLEGRFKNLLTKTPLFARRLPLKKHVNGLNLKGLKPENENEKVKDAIANEWEVTLINSLSKIGKVSHEQDFSGATSNLDIYFSSDTGDFKFVADITAVSDIGLHQKNPIQSLYFKLLEVVEENGVDSNRLYIRAEGNSENAFRGKERPKLYIPGEARFRSDIFETEKFKIFLSAIKEGPNQAYTCQFIPFKLIITYDPNRGSPGMTHDSFTYTNAVYKDFTDSQSGRTSTVSERRSPIYSALESKRNQLLKTNTKENIGIFLCDGSSDLFQQRGEWDPDFGVDRSVKDFLRQDENKGIAFVICITVKNKNPYELYLPFDDSPRYELLIEYFVSPNHITILDHVRNLSQELHKILPVPTNLVSNAINHLKSQRRNVGSSFKGGSMFSSSQIEISARELLEVLAGKTKFSDEVTNYFSKLLSQGRLIEQVMVRKVENKDDEYVRFEFGEPDQAISPFRIPSKN